MDLSEVILKLEAGVELLKRYQGTTMPREKEMLEAERKYKMGEANKATSFLQDSDPIKKGRTVKGGYWGGKSLEEQKEIKDRLAKGSEQFREFVKDINKEEFMKNFKGKGKRKAQSLLYKNRDRIDKLKAGIEEYDGDDDTLEVVKIMIKKE